MNGAPVCPDCGQEVVATVCGTDPNMSEESAEAIRWVIVAAHRRLAHSDAAEPTSNGAHGPESSLQTSPHEGAP